ncbi:hypothetical protein A9Q79_00410 [Methylophaga sp. 42_25_T18]|nr:hypothetical protein A9Q79_00410 [Methylophaga sp. 42_25_T18]
MKIIAVIVLAITFLASCSSMKQGSPPLTGKVFSQVSGKWDMVGNSGFCKSGTDIEEIRFSNDNRTAYFGRPIPPIDDEGNPISSYTYQVLYNDENSITMIVNGEDRLTETGDRMVWVLIMIDSDHFTWRATHWNMDARSQLIMKRCEN